MLNVAELPEQFQPLFNAPLLRVRVLLLPGQFTGSPGSLEAKIETRPLSSSCGPSRRDSLPLPDLGYGLATRHAGQGYAREAARACLAYAQRVLGRDELLAITSATNGPSMALLEDLGFVREGERVGDDGPTVDWRWHADPPRPQDDASLAADLVQRFWACQAPDALGLRALAALPALCTAEAQLPGLGGTVLSVRGWVEVDGLVPGSWVGEEPAITLASDCDEADVRCGPWLHRLVHDGERRWRLSRLALPS